MDMVATSLSDLIKPVSRSTTMRQPKTTVGNFFDALNEKRIDDAMMLVEEEVEFEDAAFASPFSGKAELERNMRLRSEVSSDRIIVDNVVSDLGTTSKVGIRFHMEDATGDAGKKGTAFFDLDETSGLITRAFLVEENNKSGEANLKTLNTASKIIQATSFRAKETDSPLTKVQSSMETNDESKIPGIPWLFSLTVPTPKSSLTLPEQYFEAWNVRDMKKACAVFAENVEYDDTAFPAPFTGKGSLEKHLNLCAESFPPTFSFVVDDKVDGGNKVLLTWHVENNGEELPFTRGCSFYEIKKGKISQGIDVVEPAVFKTGGLSLTLRSIQSKITEEPIRLVPLALWVAYLYVVFFSDWFFGLPATALEQRTWEEVRDLSLNFFFVSPILNLPFAPVVHPMLEGVFNLLLSWAALFVGFLSDDRRDKPNVLPMLPMVAGMQFLTSAFLLPYLVTRSSEPNTQVYLEDLPLVAQLTESRLLGPAMATVGTGAFVWATFARMQDFGGWNERLVSFLDLLSIDRVGSSFLVDLAIFALFQGWLVNDDLKRRGMSSDSALANVAKFVPFFGMAAYLTLRSPLPEKEDELA
jgi:ketosteroid isomerase-like protein